MERWPRGRDGRITEQVQEGRDAEGHTAALIFTPLKLMLFSKIQFKLLLISEL